MKAKLSSKGQIVLPAPIRTRLGLTEGDSLEVTVEDGRVILTLEKQRRPEVRLATNPTTGLPVLLAPGSAPRLTSEQVAALLSGFP